MCVVVIHSWTADDTIMGLNTKNMLVIGFANIQHSTLEMLPILLCQLSAKTPELSDCILKIETFVHLSRLVEPTRGRGKLLVNNNEKVDRRYIFNSIIRFHRDECIQKQQSV